MEKLRRRYQSNDRIPSRRRQINTLSKEKQNQFIKQEKKRSEYEESLKFLKDNELYGSYLLNKAKKENEEMMEEAIASEIRKETERREFYKEVEQIGNLIPMYELKNTIKCLNRCLFNKEFYGRYNYLLRKDKEYNQKMLSDFYDKQIMEKKFKKEYERYIDKFQAQILKKDSNDYLKREMQIKNMVRQYEKNNEKELEKQIQMQKYDIDKMTPFERKYNYDLLQKSIDFHKRNCFY